MLLFALVLLPMAPARAQSFWDRTHLVYVQNSPTHTSSLGMMRTGGYELSDGTPVRFDQWYSSDWSDIHATFLTELSENFGLYWGLSTGEAGEKYRIEPSFKLGFVAQTQTGESSTLSLSVTAIIGGRLKERNCTADYGLIGGVQTVNCRLAASPLPPDRTLEQTLNQAPEDRVRVILRYRYLF